MKKKKVINAPYVETDVHELGDSRLSASEAVIREREALLKKASVYRIYGQDELEDAERSLGPRLQYGEVIRRLQQANSQIQVRDGSPGSVALFIPKRRDEYQPEDAHLRGTFAGDHKYVTGFLKEPLPEWGHVTNDTSLVAVREVRGWRSVLISLVKQDVISYGQAIKHFGEPVGARASFWHEHLYAKKQKLL